jgi:hypothetical protein
MAYVWVSQWVALPIIPEEHMGDTSLDGGFGHSGPFQQQHTHDEAHSVFPNSEASFQPSYPITGNSPFLSQYSTIPPSQQRMDSSRYPHAAGGNSGHTASNFNMGAMTGALPDQPAHSQTGQNFQPQHQGQRRMSNSASTPAVVFQMQQNLQHPHRTAPNYNSQSAHNGFGHGQYSGYGQLPVAQSGGYPQIQQQRMGGMPQQYTGYSPISPQYYYYPGATPGYPTMTFAPNASTQTPIAGRGMPGFQSTLNAEGQDGYLGMDAYPGNGRYFRY